MVNNDVLSIVLVFGVMIDIFTLIFVFWTIG